MTINRHEILGYPIDIVSLSSSVEMVSSMLSEKKHLHVVTLNPEMIINALKMDELSKSIKNADLVIPDAFGIQLALWKQGIKLYNTTPGIELSEKCIEYCNDNKVSVAFFGAKQETLDTMLLSLKQKFTNLNVLYSRNGFFSEDEEQQIANDIASLKPSILFVALGVPKQELWIYRYKHLFPNTVLIGVGGSFDVWAGKVKRAPKILRIMKLEWFYRLIKEPFRAKRMLTSLPYFVFLLFFDKSSSLK